MPTRRDVTALLGAATLALQVGLPVQEAGAQTGAGPLFMVGGNFRLDNESLWKRYIDLAGGPGAQDRGHARRRPRTRPGPGIRWRRS
jgi:hypothetical protein